jgi:hypothetical protein
MVSGRGEHVPAGANPTGKASRTAPAIPLNVKVEYMDISMQYLPYLHTLSLRQGGHTFKAKPFARQKIRFTFPYSMSRSAYWPKWVSCLPSYKMPPSATWAQGSSLRAISM